LQQPSINQPKKQVAAIYRLQFYGIKFGRSNIETQLIHRTAYYMNARIRELFFSFAGCCDVAGDHEDTENTN
jgi:hypothetical protein